MFNSVGNYAKGGRRGFVAGFALGCDIGYDTRQLPDFADPAAVFFAFDLDRQHKHGFLVAGGVAMGCSYASRKTLKEA